MILAALVDTEALGKVVLYSLVAGVGLTAVFSVGILGLAHLDESRRAGTGARVGWALLAGVCALIVVAVVVEAIILMTTK